VNTINQGTQAKILILFPKLALPAKQQLVKVRADAMAKFLGC
jgi:hypothetical protein